MWRSRLFWRQLAIYATFGLVILFGNAYLRGDLHDGHSSSLWMVLGIMAATCVAVSWLTTQGVRMPLRRLTQAALAITQGQYAQRVHLDTADEFGELARAFNDMSRSLELQIARLDSERQELRAVFRCMVEGVIVLDAEQHVQFLNEAASRLLRLPLEASRGRKLWELVRHRGMVAAAEAVLASREPVRTEVEWNTRGQQVLAVQGSMLEGPLRGAVLVLHDISELRKLERMRQDFVANVSHELKTPLAAIQAGVETLLDGALHDPGHNLRFLERVRENAIRLDLLVQDLLTLNRIESGQELMEIKPVLLAEVIEMLLDRHEQRAAAKQLRLVVQPAEPALEVLADEEALDHLLDNLVDNAVKYTPDGGTITVSWRAEARQAVIQVADTGPGIPEKDLARIFERFYRVDRARSRELGGTGLGLSIVKHLAQALGGEVYAASTVGKGSTFTVRVPLVGAPVARLLSA